MPQEASITAREQEARLDRRRDSEASVQRGLGRALETCSFLLGLSKAELIEMALSESMSMRAKALREVLRALISNEPKSNAWFLWSPWVGSKEGDATILRALALVAPQFRSAAMPYSEAVEDRITTMLADIEQDWDTGYAVLAALRIADKLRPRKVARIRALLENNEPITIAEIAKALGDDWDRDGIRRILIGHKEWFEKVGVSSARGQGLWRLKSSNTTPES